VGSALGAYAWTRAGWAGVCMAGAAQCVVALAVRVSAELIQTAPAKLVNSPDA
jgi:hypothetical protein